ncbi:MAG: helix-turn-helix domain-containing protein [Candidatus Sumerlaeia bacterium]|nr:helix-turn-helix domain-containing protein [Candidatus Sumerlaeia bacterium]
MNFFVSALREAQQERGLNQAQLALLLGIEPPYISRWLRGAYPRLDLMVEVLGRLGWRMDRAHPGYDPIADAAALIQQQMAHHSNGSMVDRPDLSVEQFQQMLDKFLTARQRDAASRPAITGCVRAGTGEVAWGRPALPFVSDLESSLPHFARHGRQALQALLLEAVTAEPVRGGGPLAFVREALEDEEVPDGSEVVVQLRAEETSHLRRIYRLQDSAKVGKSSHYVLLPVGGLGKMLQSRVSSTRVTHVVEGWWQPSRVEG